MRIFSFLLLLGIFGGCTRSEVLIPVQLSKTVTPVFIGKTENPVLHIEIDNPTEQEIELNKLVLSDVNLLFK